METQEKQETATAISRRGIATAALGALVVPRHVLGRTGLQAPSDTIRIAGIGVGGMGRRYLQGCAGERIDVLCDIDQSFAAPVFRKYPEARVYSDYRKMFDKEEKNIDAVIVATPDHNHATITMQALKREHAKLWGGYAAVARCVGSSWGQKPLCQYRNASSNVPLRT